MKCFFTCFLNGFNKVRLQISKGIELYNFGPLTVTANLDLDNLQKGIFNITFALVHIMWMVINAEIQIS